MRGEKKIVKFYFDCIALALLFTILLEQFSWFFIQPVTYLANTLCCRIVLQTVIATLYSLLWRRRLTSPVTETFYITIHFTFVYLFFVLVVSSA